MSKNQLSLAIRSIFLSIALGLVPTTRAEEPNLLTLDSALQIALAQNRQIANAQLDLQISEQQVKQVASYHYPELKLIGTAGALLMPLEFYFPAGSLGELPDVGPVPYEDTTIEADNQFQASGLAQLNIPLSQHYQIGLKRQIAELGQIAQSERLRSRRQSVALDVRQTYYGIAQLQAAIAAAEKGIAFLAELERVTADSLEQNAVLKSDLLSSQAKRLEAEAELVRQSQQLSTLQQRLNLLLYRPLDTPFIVETIPAPDPREADLAAAIQTALENRPELRLARIALDKADLDQKVAKAAYIPDISFSLSYLRTTETEVLPPDVATAGILFQWDLFSGGRRSSEVARSHLERLKAENDESEATETILIEIQAKYSQLHYARLACQASSLKSQAEEERLRETANAFQEDFRLRADLLKQQTATETALAEELQSLANFWNAKAQFETALGLDTFPNP